MTKHALALLIASAVIAASTTAPPSFRRGFDAGAEPRTTRHFIGATWPCAGKYSDETCFAGLRLPSLLPHTGP